MSLILILLKKLQHSISASKAGDLRLKMSLVGNCLFGKTVGVVGTGQIGAHLAKLLKVLGCKILLFDLKKNSQLNDEDYVENLEILFEASDVISLHLPLTSETLHLVNDDSISKMKKGVCLINTSRGGLVDTAALIRGLKSGQIGAAGLDVYENEASCFFRNFKETPISDDLLGRLLTFPNVVLTPHQVWINFN